LIVEELLLDEELLEELSELELLVSGNPVDSLELEELLDELDELELCELVLLFTVDELELELDELLLDD
jgi:hypothetical protein